MPVFLKKSIFSIAKAMSELLSVPLLSAKGVDYKKLRDLLKAGEWELADQETLNVLKLIASGNKYYLDEEVVSQLPCEDLTTIDQLWVKASGGQFGFSVQRQIWEEYGAISSSQIEDWEQFCGALFGLGIRGNWGMRRRCTDSTEAIIGSLPYLACYSDSGGSRFDVNGLPFLLGPVDDWGDNFWGDDIVFGIFYCRIKACGL
jgi:GUN4-like